MEKHELFNIGLTSQEGFKSYDSSELQSIGLELGSDEITFKQLYIAYLKGEKSYENNPFFGAKIMVTFEPKKNEVTIKQLSTILSFSETTFVNYLNLIHLCFSKIHPVGTVVELDELLLTEDIAPGFSAIDDAQYVVLTGRKINLPGTYNDYVVDYIGRMWPHGEGSQVAPLLISNMMIKRIIHHGFIEERDEANDLTLREQLLTGMKQSLTFVRQPNQTDIIKGLSLTNNQ